MRNYLFLKIYVILQRESRFSQCFILPIALHCSLPCKFLCWQLFWVITNSVHCRYHGVSDTATGTKQWCSWLWARYKPQKLRMTLWLQFCFVLYTMTIFGWIMSIAESKVITIRISGPGRGPQKLWRWRLTFSQRLFQVVIISRRNSSPDLGSGERVRRHWHWSPFWETFLSFFGQLRYLPIFS